ncbi:MAG: menaquinone biosynthesis decarboxylase [Verrucomicrobia bacterium]|nr:menaquinone biosynthesis decarboxylase [Verrucomicrobiota bacterium]MCF7709034.1 menaquinone biosynthesis decarboxylase [Verrucomicrobiota bacterium]
MAYTSFRDFVSYLESRDELMRISTPLATELEITELADRQMKQADGGKALLIERPSVHGRVSCTPLAINTMGSFDRMAAALGVDTISAAAAELQSLVKAKPPTSFYEAVGLIGTALELRHTKPRLVKSGSCQQIVHKLNGEDGNITAGHKSRTPPTILDLPVLKCWPGDTGRFITLPCVVTRDPETGSRNIGMYRMQVFSPESTGMHWQLHKTGAGHAAKYKELGQRMPVSVFIGGDPAFTFCATAPLPDEIDELNLAGFLRKKSVPLVKCLTNDLEVPADADIVIEGYVDPSEPMQIEGPFGDHTGYYSSADYYPVFHITAVTHRNDAVYPATIVGIPPMEDFYIGSATVELFLPILKMTFPELVDLAMPAEGVFHNLVFVSIRKRYPMQAYKIMHGLWGMGQMMFTKYIVVVDECVDVHNTSQVLFHLCANTDPQRDIIFTKGPADVLDHASSHFAAGSKLGIDATRKLEGEGFNRPWPEIIKMEPAVKEKIDKLLRLGAG